MSAPIGTPLRKINDSGTVYAGNYASYGLRVTPDPTLYSTVNITLPFNNEQINLAKLLYPPESGANPIGTDGGIRVIRIPNVMNTGTPPVVAPSNTVYPAWEFGATSDCVVTGACATKTHSVTRSLVVPDDTGIHVSVPAYIYVAPGGGGDVTVPVTVNGQGNMREPATIEMDSYGSPSFDIETDGSDGWIYNAEPQFGGLQFQSNAYKAVELEATGVPTTNGIYPYSVTGTITRNGRESTADGNIVVTEAANGEEFTYPPGEGPPDKFFIVGGTNNVFNLCGSGVMLDGTNRVFEGYDYPDYPSASVTITGFGQPAGVRAVIDTELTGTKTIAFLYQGYGIPIPYYEYHFDVFWMDEDDEIVDPFTFVAQNVGIEVTATITTLTGTWSSIKRLQMSAIECLGNAIIFNDLPT